MAEGQRKRLDSRRDATRIALIEAAESLIAEAGIEGVSTRRIGAAIGSLNTNVVAYHFGSKEALVEEIYRYRLPQIDCRRRELLEQADAEGLGDNMTVLMRAFALPLFEQTDALGRHSYAGFVLGVERSGMIATRGQVAEEFPESQRVMDRITALLPTDTAPSLNLRRRLVANMIFGTLQIIDHEAGSNPIEAKRLFGEAILMAVAAIAAPVHSGPQGMPDAGEE
jgi:AcrR family transcriptional regulator